MDDLTSNMTMIPPHRTINISSQVIFPSIPSSLHGSLPSTQVPTINSIASLADCLPFVTRLDLPHARPLVDLSPLSAATRLRSLHLTGCRDGDMDLAPLQVTKREGLDKGNGFHRRLLRASLPHIAPLLQSLFWSVCLAHCRSFPTLRFWS